jgi:large repetitive protein
MNCFCFRMVKYWLLALATLALSVDYSLAQVIANDDDFLVNENEVWTGNLGDNDLLPAGQNALYSVVEAPLNGTFVFTSGGNFEYTPPLNLFGFRDSVYYQVCVNGQCDIAGVEFYVIFRNTIPFAGNDNFSVELNTPRTGSVTYNDGDPDSLTDPIDRTLHWFKITNPTNGIVNVFNPDGTFTYTPNTGFNGTDSFTYYVVDHCGLYVVATVYLTIVAPNLNPTASNQTISTLNEDQPFSASLAPLVSDPENDAITFTIVNPPSSGNLHLNYNGTYTFTPLPNFTGIINFTYNACDVVGQCAQGTITLTVNNVDNDPPQLASDSLIINEDASGAINAFANDYDDTGALTYSIFTQASNGLVSLLSASGQFNYVPNSNYFGNDSFVVQACDGLQCATSTVSVQINGVNDLPTASPFVLTLSEDSNTSGTITTFSDAETFPLNYSFLGGVIIPGFTLNSNGSYTYVAPANYFGTQSAQIRGCDGQGACVSTTFNLIINAVNDLPVASNDSFTANEDQNITGNVSNGEFDIEGSALTYTATSPANNGILNLATNGQFTYLPNANWFGSETIAIAVCDNQNGCTNTTLSLTINPINDPPLALPTSINTTEDTNFNGSLTSFVSDAENSALLFSLITAPASGLLSLNANGSFTFTPSVNFFGVLNSTFQVCDNAGSCATGSLTLNVTAVNDLPFTPNVSITLNEDATASGVINGIQDVDNTNLVLSLVQNAIHGNFILNNDGSYSYTPDSNYAGNETIIYAACDAQNACSQGTLSITVQPVEDSPQVQGETLVIEEGNTLINSVNANDTDGDGDVLTYTALGAPLGGSIVLNPNGTFVYTPNNAFIGTETIAYNACDNQGNCGTGVLTIVVVTTNTAPTATGSIQTLQEDQPLSADLSSSVLDAEGGPFSFTTLMEPQHGELQWTSGGSFIYTPAADYYGSDSFTFQVCDAGGLCASASIQLSIFAVNDAPVLLDDDLIFFEDGTFTGDISANDFDPEGDNFSYTLIDQSEFLQTTLTPAGILSIQPIANYFGNLELAYTCCDALGACSSGILNIIVNPIFDSPIALAQLLVTSEDETASGLLSATDVDSEQLIFGVYSSPSNGSLNLESNGAFTYTPAENYSGNDQFIYYAADMTGMYDTSIVFIQISPVNDAPVAGIDAIVVDEDASITFNIASNDYDPENQAIAYTPLTSAALGALTLSSNGQLGYTPSGNINGTEQISVLLCDSENACTSSTITFIIVSVNDAPTDEATVYSSNEDETLSGNIHAVASDVEDVQLSIEITGAIENGDWVLNPDGSFAFHPAPNYFGTQSISFLACDSDGACTNGEFTLAIEAVNDAPQTTDLNLTLSEDSATSGDLNASIDDPDNDAVQISVLHDVSHGTFLLNTDGSFVYAPVANYFGADSLVFSACDTQGLCTSGTIRFEVTMQNDAPIVDDEEVQVILNTTISGSLALNDEELDSDPLVYSVINDLSGGSFQLNANGSYTYVPAMDTTGLFTLNYSACDPSNLCDYGTISIYVVSEEEANTPPTAFNFAGDVCAGGSINIDLTNMIADAEESQQALNISMGNSNIGSYQLNSDVHELVYFAPANASGQVTIPFYVCDNGVISMCDTAEIQLTILATSDILITGFSTQQISCFGANDGSITLSAQTDNGTLSYLWNNSAESSTINALAPGTYSVVISSDAPCSVNQTAQFEIFEPSELIAAHAIVNDELVLTITGGTPTYSIAWNTPSGLVLNETNLPINGEGTYTYTITDAHDCAYSASVIITGISERNDLITDVYPNPISNAQSLSIRSSVSITALEIMDSKGVIVYQEKPNKNLFQINASAWTSGLYLMRIHHEQGTVTKKIIKE